VSGAFRARDDFVEYRRTGNRDLRNRLVEEHLGLSDYFVARYRNRGVADDDLRQLCLLGVLHAVERFDPEVGVTFATFASRTIEGDLKRYLRDRSWSVRPPRRAQDLYLEVRHAEEELTHELAHPPTIAQLAARLGEDEDHVLEALEAGGALRAVSLDTPSPGAGEDEAEPRPIVSAEAGYEQVEVAALVGDLLDGLSPRDRTIVEMRFFEQMSQPQIAAQIGVSQSYLSRLIRGILVDLRRQIGRDLG
jgi:RNA polymerase sigma-B factor